MKNWDRCVNRNVSKNQLAFQHTNLLGGTEFSIQVLGEGNENQVYSYTHK
jgi:hypothetical protein